ncbi:MAG: FHA domain-containing protein [Anaerolineae bacterium]|nr:FHA domain-containing protein [Anaerolineae bacterium]
MVISRVQTLSKESELILTYLAETKTAMERHKRNIRDACHLTETRRADHALSDLIDGGLLSDSGDGIYDLTQSGITAAQKLKKENAVPQSVTNITTNIDKIDGNSAVSVVGTMDIFTTPPSYKDMLQSSVSATAKKPSTSTRRRAETEETDIERTLDQVAPGLPTLKEHPLRNGLPEVRNSKGVKVGRSTTVRYLLVFDTQKDALPIPIVSGDTLGRSKKGTIMLRHDDFISNRHCRFEIVRDKSTHRPNLFVEDLGSRNGTFVDDLEVFDGKVQLHHGSRLRIGNTVMIVVEIPY